MYFAPQRCALFRHLNFQKRSERGVLCTFWLGNVLRAITACTFSTSQLPKAVWTWCALYILTWKCASRQHDVHFFDISTSKSGLNVACFVHFDFEMCFAPARRALFWHLLTWKCASRHNGVQLFISHLTTWLRTRRFSELTCRPSGATHRWKNPMFRDFPTFFEHLDIIFLDLLLLFSSLTLPISAFHLSILSEVWFLNFLRQLHY